MEQITRGIARGEAVRVGVDLAKRVIQVYAVDGAGQVLTTRALARDKFIAWCAQLPAGRIVAMESFFSSLKTERTARKVYRTREQARADVFDYIERFYNPTRRHSTLGYVSPIEFEKAQEA